MIRKHNIGTKMLSAKRGLSILEKDIPTALKMVSSESLLNLSNVNNEPKSNPTGNALPKILGISHNIIKIPVFNVVSPVKICLITLKSISGAIQTIVNKRIATKVVIKT